MFIEFGNCNIKLLIHLIYPITYQINKFVIKKKDSPFLYIVFMNFMSYFSAGLIYLIVLYRSSKDKKEKYISKKKKTLLPSNQIKNQFYLNFQRMTKKRLLKKIISIFFLALLNFTALLIENISLNLAEIDSIFYGSFDVLITIFVYVVYSKIILDTKIYKHQYISLILIMLCLLVFLAKDIILNFSEFNIGNFILSFFCFIIIFGLYAVFDVLTKRHFIINLDSPYYFMFFNGLFSLIMIIPFELIYYFKFNGNSKILGESIIKEIKNNFSPIYPLKFILNVFLGLIRLGGMTFTIYYFTPCHFVISQIISQIMSSSIEWIKDSEKTSLEDIALSIILYFIILIFALIFNEIIIIKIFSMEENTSKYISNREEDEFRHLSAVIDYADDEDGMMEANNDDEDDILEANNGDNENIPRELTTIL